MRSVGMRRDIDAIQMFTLCRWFALFLDCVAVLSCTYGEIERNEGKVPTEWYWCGIALHAER